jgi:hypothetical protein
MHCWCPPATGPGQPHESTCYQYTRPDKVKSPFFSYGPPPPFEIKSEGETDFFLQAQAYNHALLWAQNQQTEKNPQLVKYCNCAKESQSGVHESSCPVTAGQQAAQLTGTLTKEALTKEAVHKAYASFTSFKDVPAYPPLNPFSAIKDQAKLAQAKIAEAKALGPWPIGPCDCGTNPPVNHYTDCPRYVAPAWAGYLAGIDKK